MTIWVSSRLRAAALAKEHGANRAVSLLAPGDPFPVVAHLADDHHLKLSLDDIDIPMKGMLPPGQDHVEALIGFVSSWDRSAPMVIHCWAGVSRSTASAFITACLHNPDADEHAIAMTLRKASPTAKPNPRIIQIADRLMDRDGRMIEAVASMGPNIYTEEAAPFSIPSVFQTKGGQQT